MVRLMRCSFWLLAHPGWPSSLGRGPVVGVPVWPRWRPWRLLRVYGRGTPWFRACYPPASVYHLGDDSTIPKCLPYTVGVLLARVASDLDRVELLAGSVHYWDCLGGAGVPLGLRVRPFERREGSGLDRVPA